MKNRCRNTGHRQFEATLDMEANYAHDLPLYRNEGNQDSRGIVKNKKTGAHPKNLTPTKIKAILAFIRPRDGYGVVGIAQTRSFYIDSMLDQYVYR